MRSRPLLSGGAAHATKLLAAAALALAAVLNPALAGKRDNSVRFAQFTSLENIDAYFNNSITGKIIAYQVWDTLVYHDYNTNEYKGLLATAWRRLDDRTLEFDLRRGVRFHNGQEFTADDVVYTLNFVADPANRVLMRQTVSWIARAEKVDPYKVRIVSKQPFPAAIEYLAGPLVIYPHEYYAKVGPKGMNENPVGSGPYKVAQHVPGKLVVLERNADYFKDSPKEQPTIERIEIRIIPDLQTQTAELLSGGLDLIMSPAVDRDQAELLGSVPGLQVVSGESMRIRFLQMNTLADSPSPILRDVRVRRALNHAIDREALAREMEGGGVRVIDTICSPLQFGCTDEGAPHYAYDPALAKRLLAEAGFPDGFETELFVAARRAEAEAIINDLRAVGIRADLRFLQYATMRDQIRAHKAPLAVQNWGSFSIGDVSALLPVFFGLSPDDTNRDEEVARLIREGDHTMDPEARKRAYGRALDLIADRAYAVPLYAVPVYYAATADLSFRIHPDEIPHFWEMKWK